jgi:hypothetical protein
MRIPVALLLLSFPVTLSAQATDTGAPPVVAADGRVISSALVTPGVYVRTVSFVRDGQERRVGTITERVTIVGSGAAATLVRAQEISFGPRTIIDTAVSHRATLNPIWHSSKQPTASMALRFAGAHVTGTHTSGANPPEVVDQTVSVPTFDSNNQELVLGALPLAIGYRARLPMYVYESKGISWCDLQVTGDESVDGAPSWKVDVTYAGARGTYWIAKGTGVLLRNEMTLPTGAVMRLTLVK